MASISKISIPGAFIKLVLLSGFCLSSGCVAKNAVVKVSNASPPIKEEGLYYALPRTVINAEVPVKKREKRKGEFYQYAKCFFPEAGKRIVTDDKVSFELGDPIITSNGEPDPEEIYLVKIKGHYFEDKSLQMSWNESGVPTKSVAEANNRTVDVISQEAKAITSLIIKGDDIRKTLNTFNTDTSVASKEDYQLAELEEINDFFRQKKNCASGLSCENHLNSLSERIDELKKAESKAEGKAEASTEAKAVKSAVDAIKTLANSPHLIDLVKGWREFKKVQALLSSREDLVSSRVSASSADVLRLQLDEVDKLIAESRNKFIGTVNDSVWNARFEVTPDKNKYQGAEKMYPLFRFSEERGICEPPVETDEIKFPGLRVDSDFQNCTNGATGRHGSASGVTVKLRLVLLDRQLSGVIERSVVKPTTGDERGFYYRIPAFTFAEVFSGDEEISRTRIQVAQLGLVVSLPASTGGRRTKYDMELYETGAMKNFSLGSDALLQPSNLNDAGGAVDSVLDSKLAAAKKKAEDNDEAAKIKSLADLLADCKKIKEAQENLGQSVNLPKKCQQ